MRYIKGRCIMKRCTYISVLMCLLILGIAGCGANSETAKDGVQIPPKTETSDGPKVSNGVKEGKSQTKDPVANKPVDDSNDSALTQLKELSLEEKVGQLVIVGMEGTTVDSSSRKLLNTYHVGGFIFFKDNMESIDQSVQLFNSLKKANAGNPIPLWMSIDEEGGRVSRMPDPFVKLPSSGKVGENDDPALAQEIAGQIGKRLFGFGLNMAYAPVLDVNSNPDNPVIGDRSFGSSAKMVSRLGIAAMKGIQETGVVPAVKHFPGHGDTSVDSHFGLPVVEHDKERLNKLELAPFKDAIDNGADVVMVSHLLMSKIDPETPASFSKPVITGLLREQLGFNGVVITDDMTMGAVGAGEIEIGEAAIRSVLAGTNIVLVGHEYDKEEAVIKSLIQAVKSKRITEKILDERVLTILRLKQKYNINDQPVTGPDVKQLNAEAKQLISKLK